jgi:hypothetical protein
MSVSCIHTVVLFSTVGTESKFNGCDLIVQATEKSFYICVPSPEARDSWFKDYTNAMVKRKVQAQKQPADGGLSLAGLSVAPIWRPNDTSGLCSRCNAEFSIMLRRHHCRKCGNIVCDNCSKDRVVIANIDNGKAVRVCAPCKLSLTAPAGSGASIPRRPSASAPPPRPPPARKPPCPSLVTTDEAGETRGQASSPAPAPAPAAIVKPPKPPKSPKVIA